VTKRNVITKSASDEAISISGKDCFAALAMTTHPD
jgi:hypothetical protein